MLLVVSSFSGYSIDTQLLKLHILDKLLFYSVISSYRIKWVLDKTKKTGTVTVRGLLRVGEYGLVYFGWLQVMLVGLQVTMLSTEVAIDLLCT